MSPDPTTSPARNEFERLAKGKSGSTIGELFEFLRANKKWWLIPLLGVAMLLGAVLLLSGTVVAPFIYTLF